jgi:membrane protease YdiL (CAAX protease family)
MKKLRTWINGHQLSGFLLITFLFSWLFFLVTYLIFPVNIPLQVLCGKIAVFGPALAVIYVSSGSSHKQSSRWSGKRKLVFGSVWLFSWIILLLNAILVLNVKATPGLIVAFSFSALLPAYIISASLSVNAAVRDCFYTLLKPGGRPVWYLVALLGYPVLILAGILITISTGGNVGFNQMSPVKAVFFPVLMFAEGYLASGGVNEETGWRGFLLPRLQSRYPVLIAALVVWLFWALWNLPLDIFQHIPLQQILVNRLILNLFASVLFAWVFNRTRGSIMAPALFHSSMNTSGAFLPATLLFLIPLVIFFLFAIIYDRMWKKLPHEHPAVIKTMPADDKESD